MRRLLKAFLFKIKRDITLKITLIVGAGIAVLMTLIYLGLDVALEMGNGGSRFLTGPSMLLNSLSPVQNFGIAIPVNLISFICLEFSQGTIRNKIIAGHSKFKIYTSLMISGLIFAFILLGVYLLLCTGLGTIFGGFDLNKEIFLGITAAKIDGLYLFQMLVVCFFTYVSIVSFTVFISTLFRQIGPSIPVVMVILMILYLSASIVGTIVSSSADIMEGMEDLEAFGEFLKVTNPLYVISGGGAKYTFKDVTTIKLETSAFIFAICNNIVYAIAFFVGGAILFKKRDVK